MSVVTTIPFKAPAQAYKKLIPSLTSTAHVVTLASNKNLIALRVHNTGTAVVYVKGWIKNSASSGPTVGTDANSLCIPVAAGDELVVFLNGITGLAAGTGNYWWVACVAEAGQAGTTSPTTRVELEAWVSG